MNAIPLYRFPRLRVRLLAAARWQAARWRTALRPFAHRLAVRTLNLQPDIAPSPPAPRPLCRLEELPDGGVVGIDPARPLAMPLVLRRQGAHVQAWLNACPHDGRRMNWAPGRFQVKDGVLRCAVRGARFALDRGGLCVGGPCRGRSLLPVPVRVENGLVTIPWDLRDG